MIHLLGFICFFSMQGCAGGEKPFPQIIGKPFPTMQACEEFKAKLDGVTVSVEWVDVKSECVQGTDVL